MNSASASMASAPSMIGAESPASQFAIVRPIAVSSEAAATIGTSARCAKRPGISPARITATAPPTVAKIGDRPW